MGTGRHDPSAAGEAICDQFANSWFIDLKIDVDRQAGRVLLVRGQTVF